MFGTRKTIVNQWERLQVDGPHRVLARCSRPRCSRRAAACADSRAPRSTWTSAASATRTCRGARIASPGFLVRAAVRLPVDDMIRELKYHGAIENARVLGVLLAAAAREREAPLPRLLVPVPLHAARLASAASTRRSRSRVTRGACSGVPFAGALVRRVRDTPSQTALDIGGAARATCAACSRSRVRAPRRRLVGRGARGYRRRRGDHGQHGRGAARGAARRGCQAVEVWAVARATAPARDTTATAR